MSGYLQRMALNARNPGGAIHPVVGSLFSAPTFETPPPGLEIEEIAFGSQPEPFEARSPEAPRVLVPENATPNQDPNPDSRQQQALAPALPERLDEPAFRSFEIGSEAALLKERLETSRKERPAPRSEQRPEGRRQVAILRDSFKPLIEESVPSTSPQATFIRDSHPLAPAATRKENRDLSGRIAAPAHEPDEIEIHIGRIEVIAVPQSAARPAAQPARKSPDLDEYLKRGRGEFHE